LNHCLILNHKDTLGVSYGQKKVYLDQPVQTNGVLIQKTAQPRWCYKNNILQMLNKFNRTGNQCKQKKFNNNKKDEFIYEVYLVVQSWYDSFQGRHVP